MNIPVITVEGNTGAGKTTLLQKLEVFINGSQVKIKTDHEPVGAFQSFYGNDMINPLENFYQNLKENAFTFQNCVLDIYHCLLWNQHTTLCVGQRLNQLKH